MKVSANIYERYPKYKQKGKVIINKISFCIKFLWIVNLEGAAHQDNMSV